MFSPLKHNKTHEVMNTAVIRDDVGRLRLRQCTPKLKNRRVLSQAVQQKRTDVDVMNRVKWSQALIRIVRGC
jgi:hypothetical protein